MDQSESVDETLQSPVFSLQLPAMFVVRLGWGLTCLALACAGCGGKPDPAVIAAAEQIQKLGGTFILHGTTIPIKPNRKLPEGRLSVQEVDLNGKQLRDNQLETLKPLTQIEKLHIEGSYLTDAGMAHLQVFTKLKELDLHKSNYITDKGLESLTGLKNLTKLELSYTKTSDKGSDSLLAMKSLKFLHLTGTRVTSEGLKKLRTGLPGCEILK